MSFLRFIDGAEVNVLALTLPHLVHLRLRLLQSSVAGEVRGRSRRAPVALRGPWSSCIWSRPAEQQAERKKVSRHFIPEDNSACEQICVRFWFWILLSCISSHLSFHVAKTSLRSVWPEIKVMHFCLFVCLFLKKPKKQGRRDVTRCQQVSSNLLIFVFL